MRIRFLLLALIGTATLCFGIVPLPVAAQDVDPARLTPLEPGNRWEYRVEQITGSNAPGAFLRYAVEPADTLIENQRYGVLRMEAFDAGLNPVFLRRCAFRVMLNQWPDVEPLDGDPDACRPAIPLPPFAYPAFSLNDTVRVGESTYIVDATARYAESHSGTGGSGGSLDRYFATDIGTYEHSSEIFGRSLPPIGQDHHWVATLTYAEVGGTTYGSESVVLGSEQPPAVDAAVPRIARLYPHPFQHEVRFEVSGLRAGSGQAEVFDLTGRRVLARAVELGRGAITLRMTSGPSGVYLLRVTDASGRQVVRVLIRVASEIE